MYNITRGKKMKKLGKKIIVCGLIFSAFLGGMTSCQQLKIEINTGADAVETLETSSESDTLVNI